MLKVGPSVTGSEVAFGVTGGGQAGCLACNKRQVVSLLGAMPLDNSIRQALPVNPERPRETAELIALLLILTHSGLLCDAAVVLPTFCHCPKNG